MAAMAKYIIFQALCWQLDESKEHLHNTQKSPKIWFKKYMLAWGMVCNLFSPFEHQK